MLRDRREAAARLLPLVRRFVSPGERPVVLGLPRGGVPVAADVAAGLGAPLDVVLVRKLGVPGHEELAAGAIASGDVRVRNDGVIAEVGLAESALDAVAARERERLRGRERRYRAGRPAVELAGRTSVLVDDGTATGASMLAAAAAVRRRGAERLVVALPVAPPDVARRLAGAVDAVVVVERPQPFGSVGAHYEAFDQVPDDEVVRLLDASQGASADQAPSSGGGAPT